MLCPDVHLRLQPYSLPTATDDASLGIRFAESVPACRLSRAWVTTAWRSSMPWNGLARRVPYGSTDPVGGVGLEGDFTLRFANRTGQAREC